MNNKPGATSNAFSNNGTGGDIGGQAVDMIQNGERQSLGPVTMSNGAIFTGEWLNGLKDGYGQQVWPDGSKYEGDWKNDQANGRGRLVHADGDVYDGDWINDKAHG